MYPIGSRLDGWQQSEPATTSGASPQQPKSHGHLLGGSASTDSLHGNQTSIYEQDDNNHAERNNLIPREHIGESHSQKGSSTNNLISANNWGNFSVQPAPDNFVFESGNGNPVTQEARPHRRRGILTHETRVKANRMRSLGACWRCRIQKLTVSHA